MTDIAALIERLRRWPWPDCPLPSEAVADMHDAAVALSRFTTLPPATESEVMPVAPKEGLGTGPYDTRPLSATGAAPPPEEIAGLAAALDWHHAQAPKHKYGQEHEDMKRVAAALRSQAQELERTKDDLRRVQSVYDFAKLSAERDSLVQEVERLRNQSALDRTISGASLERIRELEAEVQRLKTEHINAEMAHGALHAIHELLDDGGVPRGTFADDHVRNLVAMYNQRGLRIRELEGELATWKDISVTIEKARAAIRAKTIEECKKAIVNVRFGAPSNWGGDRPRGWHLNRPCTPQEASYHDNGCNDAFMAVSAIASKAECPEQPSEP